MTHQLQQHSMRAFLLIWAGQLVSLIGSGLTRFALGVWMYEQTGQVTQMALVAFFPEIVIMIVAPFAGALVDRWDRRRAMMLSDAGAGLCTMVVALLLLNHSLEHWHIYLAATISAGFSTFQAPAFAAATTLLVPKQHYGRASGLVQLGQAISHLVSPVLAGLLIIGIKLQGIILIDMATFLFAVTTVMLIRIPRPAASAEGAAAKGSLLREVAYGWTYIRERPGLLGMLVYLAAINFFLGITQILLTPLILAFESAATLGMVLSVAGLGMLIGSVVLAAWGGPKRRIYAVLSCGIVQGVSLIVAGLQPSTALIMLGLFIFLVGFPIMVGSAEAIWMSKVTPDVQGRVFAMRNTIVAASLPLAYLAAGPLADTIFSPLLLPDGPLAGHVGPLLGVGAGRGIRLLFILMGALAIISAVFAYLYPRLRHVEDELPDAVMAADAPGALDGMVDDTRLLAVSQK